jgi:hypothetical protein
MKGKFGIIKLLSAMMFGHVAMAEGHTNATISTHRNKLLTNGYSGPEPKRQLNQRQKRKAIRQQPHGR